MLKKLNFFNHALASADFPEPVVLARPIDVERCWWVLAVCGIGSGFVAEVHLRGGLWSGSHRYHVEMRALFGGRWVC